ncbi:MAG: NADH-quinone oxidoreductase subunit N [Caldilineales bacterium]
MTLPQLNFLALLPQIIVTAAALLVLVVDAVDRRGAFSRRVLSWLALIGLFAAGVAVVWLAVQGDRQSFQDMSVADGYSLAFSGVILLAAVLGVLLAKDTVNQFTRMPGAYYALLLLAVVGMISMASATDLIVVFLSLEILSLALYVLVGFNLHEPRSAEASLKYFLLGAFASGFFLYGAALLYGATGSTNIAQIGHALNASGGGSLYLYAGTALLIVGFGFKIAMAPFHMWTPDAYQGAPTPVTGFMSVATKTAAFAAFMRVLMLALPASQQSWGWALAILAAVTMTLGNLAALRQASLKRMLAYSSIAHAGYALVGLVPGTAGGAVAVLFYMLSYALMNLGAFAVLVALERRGENDVQRGDLSGLADRRPGLAAAMAIFMFALAGIPPFVGFFAKFFVFSAAAEAGWIWLVVIGVINSVISAYYYLSVVVGMYFKPQAEAAPAVPAKARKSRDKAAPAAAPSAPAVEAPALATSQAAVRLAVILAAIGTVAVGIYPAPWTAYITQAVQSVFGG